MKNITWAMIQKEKQAKIKKEKIKEILQAILLLAGLLIAMAWAGGTFPY